MNTYIVQRDSRDDVYYLIPGNKEVNARCSCEITNPGVVKQYAYDYNGSGLPTKPQYVLKNVVTEPEFTAYGEVEILSFEVM